jgi:P27 family predicted phage terminase small subunit
MGRPKTPIERMAAKSPDGKTPGKRNLPEPYKGAINHAVPEPPIPFHGRAAIEWENIWEAGWWLRPDQDYHWVEMIANAYADIAVFQAVVQEEGLTVRGYAGQVVAHPLIGEIRKAQAMIQKCLSTLGFSPTDRAKLQLREVETRSKLQQMMDRSKK